MIQVVAHRGASRAERENTIAAFRAARRMGADAVELDVRRTRDGVLVVHHDEHWHDEHWHDEHRHDEHRHGDTGGAGRLVHETTRAELPAHVPTLGEALDACEGMWVNVEVKNDPVESGFDATEWIADETIAHLLARHEDERWLISCFRIETVDRCRQLAAQIRTAWLVAAVPSDAASTCAQRGHAALHPWVGTLDRATVDACHRLGVQVNTWTCDDPTRMVELIGWGVDGICTNVPDVAVATRRDVRARGAARG